MERNHSPANGGIAMQLQSLLRRTSWTLATAVGAGVLAGFGAASEAAQASALDIRHDSYASRPIAATTYLRNDFHSSYGASRRPVRHRIERYEASAPKSFLTLGG